MFCAKTGYLSGVKIESLSVNSSFYRNFPKKHLLNKIRKKVVKYLELFSKVYQHHLENEIEVQIRDGEITPSGETCLDDLQTDFQTIQFDKVVSRIFIELKVKYGILADSTCSLLLDVAFSDVMAVFRDVVLESQRLITLKRHKFENELCQQKCKSGIALHNFTEVKLPEALMDILSNGLNNVPKLNTDKEKLGQEMEQEAILTCKNVFFSHFGRYPVISNNGLGLSSTIIQILSQCQSNSVLVSQLAKFRDDFVNSLPIFLNLHQDSGINIQKVLKLIPSDCIISQSDKNLGVSILPPSWYEKEYKSQIIKGGHEKMNISELQCIKILSGKIEEFRSTLSRNQRMILKQYWPPVSKTYRIGVLKLVPKVFQLMD